MVLNDLCTKSCDYFSHKQVNSSRYNTFISSKRILNYLQDFCVLFIHFQANSSSCLRHQTPPRSLKPYIYSVKLPWIITITQILSFANQSECDYKYNSGQRSSIFFQG
uniref:Uncharacterized protein n=1 Tax=Micrurus lemniscatus lemniscatus TaxID=129467 RepID=A0A2D4HPC5_MICLE